MLSTVQRRGFMWRVYDLTTSLTAAATTYSTLLIALQALTSANFSVAISGQITMTSGNGKEVQFGSLAGASPSDFAESAAGLRDLYVDSKAKLIDSGIGAPTDAQIFTEMMDRLKPVRTVTTSFANLYSNA